MKFNARKLHGATEAQTSFHWDVTFSGPPFATYGEELRMLMTSSSIPKGVQRNLEVNLHGFTFPQPGMVNRNGAIDLQAVGMVNGKIDQCMLEWQKNIYSVTEDGDISGVQLVDHPDLFGKVVMRLFNKRENKVTKMYTLNGVLLGDYDSGLGLQDGAESMDYAKPAINLAYAWFSTGIGGENRNL